MTADENMILTDTPAEGVRLLTLNRHEKRNALTTALLEALAERLEWADSEDAVRVIVITGGDKAFAAGADIGELSRNGAADGLADIRPAIWNRIRAMRKPLIAAVEGWCLGAGNELLMCCDLAVASREAKFGQPETSLGIIPGAGGCSLLPRLTGRSLAMKMALTGEPVSAEEAFAFGLVAELCEPGEAKERAAGLASKLAARAPLALQQAKAVIKATFDTPLSGHLAMERQAFSMLCGTSDKKEGVAAFLEKRSPSWRGE